MVNISSFLHTPPQPSAIPIRYRLLFTSQGKQQEQEGKGLVVAPPEKAISHVDKCTLLCGAGRAGSAEELTRRWRQRNTFGSTSGAWPLAGPSGAGEGPDPSHGPQGWMDGWRVIELVNYRDISALQIPSALEIWNFLKICKTRVKKKKLHLQIFWGRRGENNSQYSLDIMALSQKAVQTLHSLAGISTQETSDTQVNLEHSYANTGWVSIHPEEIRTFKGHSKTIPYMLPQLFSSPTELMCKFRKYSLN